MQLNHTTIFLFLFSGLVTASRSTFEERDDTCPTSPTTISDCTEFVCSVSGDTCASLAAYWGITTAQFISYNPVVGSSCSNFTIGQNYCVEENYGRGPASTSTTTTTTPTAPATGTPTPTQPGMVNNCQRFYKVLSGDTCAGIVAMYNNQFTIDDFYAWNPAVGSTCGNLQPNFYVCTAIPGTPTSVTSTGTGTTSTGVSPTQTGIAKNCNKYYKVVSGDSCQGIVDKYNDTFTINDFYSWNTAINTQCTNLQPGYYVCVGVSGGTTTTPTTTTKTTSTGSSKPSPTQSGLVANCNKFYKAAAGDTCDAIATKFCTFTSAQFINWNPAVGSSCTNLIAGDYYCVGVPTTPTTCIKTTTTKPTTTAKGPQPQETGTAANCDRYHYVISGDTCQSIVTEAHITLTQFRFWNKSINPGCTNLYKNYYYCTGVS